MSTKVYEFNTLGFDLQFNAPASADEIDRALGTPGACATAYLINFYAYQIRNKAFRKQFCEELNALVPDDRKRKTTTVTGKKTGEEKEVFDEEEQAFVNRVDAEKLVSREDMVTLSLKVNDEIGDWSPVSVPDRKPAKQYMDDAKSILGKIGAGTSTNERVIANLESALSINFESQYGEFTKDNLARALKALDDKRKHEATSSLL